MQSHRIIVPALAARSGKVQSQKQGLGARARRLQQADASSLPPFYAQLAQSVKFTEMAVQVCAAGLPCNFDLDQPAAIQRAGLLEPWLTKPMMQQVLTGFGGKCKKMAGYAEDGKTSNTFVVKQGKEETEELFRKLAKPLGKAPMNLVKVAAAWSSASWLSGLKPGFHQCGLSPNSAAAFKLIVLGEVDTWLVSMPSLLQAAGAANMECARPLLRCWSSSHQRGSTCWFATGSRWCIRRWRRKLCTTFRAAGWS